MPRLFLCQMRDLPADPECHAPDCDLRASGGSYAHKGMHMTWMRKGPNRRKKPPKPAKNPPKTAKKCQSALAHLTKGTPSAEKSPGL